MKTLSYHSDEKFKTDFVAMTRLHREQDRYVTGLYSQGDEQDFRGCSVGCSVHSLKLMGKNGMDYGNHAALATTLGWPEWLCQLQDTLFEGLPIDDAKQWTEKLADAVPVGVDLEPVKWHFCAFLMRENIERVLVLTIDDALKKQVVDSVRSVLAVHEAAIRDGKWDASAAWSVESAARSAASAARSAASAARSAASVAWSAASAARSAASVAWSAASAARSVESAASVAWSVASAARSAAWSAESVESAASAAWSDVYVRHSEELLRILKETK